ncbi:hypothetical protein Barb7_01660 [Bacteroidales bacterium Barb7]|nr:hypothetical protein Barb7_01660 [Bacteroidales bacterium Barb7]
MVIALPINVGQFHAQIIAVQKGFAVEKVGGVVMLFQQIPFIFFGYGGQLLKVANQEKLYAAKGLALVPKAAEHIADGIQQIRPHHANLVNHEQVHALDDVYLVL